jgi:hypothetical protein
MLEKDCLAAPYEEYETVLMDPLTAKPLAFRKERPFTPAARQPGDWRQEPVDFIRTLPGIRALQSPSQMGQGFPSWSTSRKNYFINHACPYCSPAARSGCHMNRGCKYDHPRRGFAILHMTYDAILCMNYNVTVYIMYTLASIQITLEKLFWIP